MLPTFGRLRRESLLAGRLEVLGSGGNTMRTEFEVLTGVSQAVLGLDRFSPYHAFAHRPIQSLAWRLRAEGYRTLCVHPFDRRFYKRNVVMPNLGFDAFIGEEAFAGAQRNGRYVSDIALGKMIAELLEEEGRGTFIFAISMGNHGPWDRGPVALAQGLAKDLGIAQEGLERYLTGLAQSDVMLGEVCSAMARRHQDGLVGFYGDHLPSFPALFDRLCFTDRASDYLVWRPNSQTTKREDLLASELGHRLLAELTGATATSAPAT
jgi:phosphoglycerol transferase MdoB-like AlkP superfamily enzyme